MDFFRNFVNQHGVEILFAILTFIASYVGIEVKRLYGKYVKDSVVKSVIRICVKAVEQMYTDLHGEDKLNKCIEYASAILADKGIVISEVELRVIIEAAVNELNSAFVTLVGEEVETEEDTGKETEE